MPPRRPLPLAVLSSVLALASIGPAAAQVPAPGRVSVQQALVTADAAGSGGTGHVKLKALLRQIDPVTAIVDGTLRVRIQDGDGFAVTVVPTGCRVAPMSVTCRHRPTGVALRLRVRISSGVPTWEMRLVVNKLGDADTGLARPKAPLRVLVDGLGRDTVVNQLRDCRAKGARSLDCGAARPPNVIVVVTDDQRWDSLAFMPRLQARVAAEGMRFDNAFVSTPVCCPSRATILTGLWAHNHGTLTLGPPDGGATKFVGADASTMATWLQAAGYRTGFFGKYLNNYRSLGPPFAPTWYVPPGWTRWRALREEDYYDFEVVTESGLLQVFTGREHYSTDVMRDQVLTFIDESLAAQQPFLVHFTPFGPHAALDSIYPHPAPRHEGLFADLPLPLPPNFDELDAGDKPGWVQALPTGSGLKAAFARDSHRRHAETLQSVDEAVAAMLDRLEAAGAANDTVLIFTSDNGLAFGEHRIFLTKLCQYEECIRVPFVIRAPGLGAVGQTSARLVQNVDIAPTVAALAGVIPPNLVDGRSVVPLLLGDEAGWRSDLLFEQWRVFTSHQFVAVRTETWKFVEDRDTGEQELYDLVADPYELQNVAGDPANAALRDELRARAFALFAASPDQH